jgi:hypothetical protein
MLISFADLQARLFRGEQAIVAAFQQLPITQHPLTTSDDKFVVDSWAVGELGYPDPNILIVVHGELAEGARACPLGAVHP